MKTNLSKATLEKNVINFVERELNSPFAVLNYINKNRKEPEIFEFLEVYGINRKLTLEDLCGLYDYTDKNIFCKLVRLEEESKPTYCSYKTIKIGNTVYEYIPVKFTVKEFIKSLKSALKIQKANEKTAQMYANLFESKEKKETKKADKKAADLSSKIAQKAKELQSEFPDLPEAAILKIAQKFFKAA